MPVSKFISQRLSSPPFPSDKQSSKLTCPDVIYLLDCLTCRWWFFLSVFCACASVCVCVCAVVTHSQLLVKQIVSRGLKKRPRHLLASPPWCVSPWFYSSSNGGGNRTALWALSGVSADAGEQEQEVWLLTTGQSFLQPFCFRVIFSSEPKADILDGSPHSITSIKAALWNQPVSSVKDKKEISIVRCLQQY